MAVTEYYAVTGTQSQKDLEDQLNRILLRIAQRLDKLEGIRGESTVQESLYIKSDGVTLHGVNTENEV